MDLRSFVANYQDIFFYRLLEKNLSDCRSVLDVGCGVNSPLGRVKKKFFSVGIDIFRPSVRESKKKKIHDKYKVGNIMEIDKFYSSESFDAVIALDAIEHLKRREALILIRKMEKIAKKKIIILTPNGFRHQHHPNNPYEEYRSGWTAKDMRQLGYKAYGLRGIKFVRGEWATIKYKPWLFWGVISFLSEPLLYHFPSLSYHLFAIKKISYENN